MGVLYPQTCCFCGTLCGKYVCSKCISLLEYIKEPVCKKCGKPILESREMLCFDCSKNVNYFKQGKSLWLHSGRVRWSIYQFKYHNRRTYGLYYADEMWRRFGEQIRQWEIDVIIPVPLHPKRKRERGYNQSEILAKRLGKRLNIPVDAKAVIRKKKTTAQKNLNHKERAENMRDAFEVRKMRKNIKNILIVDDIYTTGNTINELSKALQKKGDFQVFFLTISIGQGF